MTLELVLLAPALAAMLLFLVLATRITDSRLRIDDVAHQSARAASIAPNPTQAVADAESTARAALADAGIVCEDLDVATDTRGLAPGGAVRVTVSCTLDLRDLAVLDLPGAATLRATSTSPVDLYGDHVGAWAGP